MKADIHPKYYPEAKVKCGCGNKFAVGATVPEMSLDICSKCHPFYTGSTELVDTTGRVERFKARRAKAVTRKKSAKGGSASGGKK